MSVTYRVALHRKTGRRGRPQKFYMAWDPWDGPSLTRDPGEAFEFESLAAAEAQRDHWWSYRVEVERIERRTIERVTS